MNSTIQKRIEAIQREETPKGYKKTKWGIIPLTWETAKVAQIGEITTGSTPSTSNKSYFGNQYLWVTPTDINCKYITSTNTKLSEEGIKKVRFLEKNSVLVTCIASIGKNAILTEAGACNQQINAITVNDHYNHEFIYYKMCETAPVLERFAGKTATPIINKIQFSNLILAFPPLPEQETIAKILTLQDKLIDLLQRLIDEKRRQKKYLMQTLLTGKTRLPGFKGQWKTQTLGEIADINKGVQINKSTLANSGLYYVLNGGIVPSGYCNSWNVEANTISISEGGNSCGFVNFNKCRFWSGGHCYTLQNIATNAIQSFLYDYLKFKELNIMRLRVGSGLPNIQKNKLSKFIIPLPPLPEQEAIAEILSTADEELSLLERELEQEKLRKKALMQLLLTGLVRVEEL